MDEFTETYRRTPSTFHHIGSQSPRVGGCVDTFFHMIDWKLSKRFSSTKQIAGDRPKQEALYAKRETVLMRCTNTTTLKSSPSITEGDEASTTPTNTLTFNSTPSPGSCISDGTCKRVPGVVARLPDEIYPISRLEAPEFCCDMRGDAALDHVDSPPVLLHELLGKEFHQRSKRTSKLMSFTKKERATRSTRPFQNNNSCTGDVFEPSMKQPFLSRLKESAPNLHHSKPLSSSSSPLLSPSMPSGYTMRLLHSKVKDQELGMQHFPSSENTTPRDAPTHARSVSGGSFRTETRSIISRSSSGDSSANSSSRSFRTSSISRTWSERHDRPKHNGYESYSSGSQSFRTRYDPGKQDLTSRRPYKMASSRSGSPQKTHGSRISNLKTAEAGFPTPHAVLGTHEASIREFKTDLGNVVASPRMKNLESQEAILLSEDFEALPCGLAPTTPMHVDATAEKESPQHCQYNQKTDFDQGFKGTSEAQQEKSVTGGGFRSIRFRNKNASNERDVNFQGNRRHPSDKQPLELSVGLSLLEEKKTGIRSSYSVLFSNKKHATNKECTEKIEALKKNRSDNASMRSLLKGPRSTSGPSFGPSTKVGSQNVERTSKHGKKSNLKVGMGRLEITKSLANQGSSLTQVSSEGPLSPIRKQFERARYKSVDDVFPEIPLEEDFVDWISPDLGKTIIAVEDQFLGFGTHGEIAVQDCRSIERMFGKGISENCVPVSPSSSELSLVGNAAPKTSPMSPEVLSGKYRTVPGMVSNNALVKCEEMHFLSQHPLKLQEIFEVVHRDRSNDLCDQLQNFHSLEDQVFALDDVDACSNSASCDTGGTPERLEIQIMPVAAGWSEDVATPPALKKFEEKLALGFCDFDEELTLCPEECEQPSPVSVLVSPFLDEVSTTPDTSFSGSQQSKKELLVIDDLSSSPSEEQAHPTKENVINYEAAEVAMQNMIKIDELKQGKLSISRVQNFIMPSTESPFTAPIETLQELSHIRDVLDAVNPPRDLESGCYPAKSHVNLPFCDVLEFGNVDLDKLTFESRRWCTLSDAPGQRSGMKSEERLFIDSIREVMDLEPWMKTSPFRVDLPMFPEMSTNSKFRSPIVGEPLVKEVHNMIRHWRDIAGNVLDDLIDYDMNVPEGRWLIFSQEVAEVGLDIERMLLKMFLGEIIDDLASLSTVRTLKIP